MRNLNRVQVPVRGSFEDISLHVPRNNFSLGGSSGGSLNNLVHEPVPFNRMCGTPASRESLSFNSPNISRLAPGSSFDRTTYSNLSSGDKIPSHRMGGGPGSGSSNTSFENSMY